MKPAVVCLCTEILLHHTRVTFRLEQGCGSAQTSCSLCLFELFGLSHWQSCGFSRLRLTPWQIYEAGWPMEELKWPIFSSCDQIYCCFWVISCFAKVANSASFSFPALAKFCCRLNPERMLSLHSSDSDLDSWFDTDCDSDLDPDFHRMSSLALRLEHSRVNAPQLHHAVCFHGFCLQNRKTFYLPKDN